jgi:hypothetical protein
MKDKKTGQNANSVSSSPDSIPRDAVLPSSRTRPARNRGGSSKRDRRGGGAWPWVIGLAVVGGLGWFGYETMQGEDLLAGVNAKEMVEETLVASKRAVFVARSSLETTVRESDHVRRGYRAKKGPKFKAELEANRRAKAVKRKELAARGLTPALERKEVDKSFARAKKSLTACYRKYFDNLGNFHKVNVGVEIAANGRVETVELLQDKAPMALRACVAKAVKRLRFRGKRESSEAHQLFMVLGKVKSIRK